MAFFAFVATIKSALTSGQGREPAVITNVAGAAPSNGAGATLATDVATMNTDRATFETALAVLVADGATPTQAHVTTANTAYTTLKNDMAAVTTDSGTVTTVTGADVKVEFNATNVTSRSMLAQAIRHIMKQIEGSSSLTP